MSASAAASPVPGGGSSGAGRGGNVRVVCRVRPQNRMEERHGGTVCVSLAEQSISVNSVDGNSSFAFDRVFGPGSSQEDVFRYVGEPVIQDVMRGYNGTVFAYGQTSSGKTHTMEGPSLTHAANMGIIPRTAFSVFDAVLDADETVEFTVSVSYVEIYMERIRDLLDPSKVNIQVREDKARGIFLENVTEQYVASPEELLEVIALGAANRAIAATGMNEGSSRSHSVVIITVSQKDTRSATARKGRLYLVDLAGSEMVRKTGAAGQQLEEAKMINKSLSALGQVINALTTDRAKHVPYRDSKLTRVLQESLGGNARTSLIVCCSPSSFNAPETISTLRFGARAKSVQNRAVVNEERSSAEMKKLLTQAEHTIDMQQQAIAALQQQLAAAQAAQDAGGEAGDSQAVAAPASPTDVVLQAAEETAASTEAPPPAARARVRTVSGASEPSDATSLRALSALQARVAELEAEARDARTELSQREEEVAGLNAVLSEREARESQLVAYLRHTHTEARRVVAGGAAQVAAATELLLCVAQTLEWQALVPALQAVKEAVTQFVRGAEASADAARNSRAAVASAASVGGAEGAEAAAAAAAAGAAEEGEAQAARPDPLAVLRSVAVLEAALRPLLDMQGVLARQVLASATHSAGEAQALAEQNATLVKSLEALGGQEPMSPMSPLSMAAAAAEEEEEEAAARKHAPVTSARGVSPPRAPQRSSPPPMEPRAEAAATDDAATAAPASAEDAADSSATGASELQQLAADIAALEQRVQGDTTDSAQVQALAEALALTRARATALYERFAGHLSRPQGAEDGEVLQTRVAALEGERASLQEQLRQVNSALQDRAQKVAALGQALDAARDASQCAGATSPAAADAARRLQRLVPVHRKLLHEHAVLSQQLREATERIRQLEGVTATWRANAQTQAERHAREVLALEQQLERAAADRQALAEELSSGRTGAHDAAEGYRRVVRPLRGGGRRRGSSSAAATAAAAAAAAAVAHSTPPPAARSALGGSQSDSPGWSPSFFTRLFGRADQR